MADWLHDNPWRQGHALTPESAKALGVFHPDSPDDTIVVIASHDCDLAGSIEVEPLCEVVIGRRITALNGGRTNGKSGRCLHLTCSHAETVSLVELEIHRRCHLKKTDLADHYPSKDVLLTASERELFQSWLAARYKRPSFPDEFVARLSDSKIDRKLEKKLTDTSSHILAALFDIDEGKPDTERKGENDAYSLSIYLVHSVEGDPSESRKIAEKAAGEIIKIFESAFKKDGRWLNIELVSCEPLSEEEISLRIARLMRRWNLDHISHRSGHQIIGQ